MTAVLAGVLAVAVLLLFKPPGGAVARFRRAAAGAGADRGAGARALAGDAGVNRSAHAVGLGVLWSGMRWSGQERGELSLTLVVQQLAALLKGGRTPARLWDELWLVHQSRPDEARGHGAVSGLSNPAKGSSARRHGSGLSPGSLMMLSAVRASASRGLPVSDGIRRAAPTAFPRAAGREPRIWLELAACFDIAEASGCPLADVLARFAAQLEVEEDAHAARQTALAGPKATVRLLTWLPGMGLGLGMALGVDPLAMLFGTPLGMAALAAGVALTVAGRIWSARLVHTAAGATA